MKATLYVVEDPALMQNGIFFSKAFYGMKNSAFMFASLRTVLAQYGIDLSTQDINPPEYSELVIGVDMALPFKQASWDRGQKKYLVLSEPATYYPHNWEPANHTAFDKVFTYNTRLVDDKKYFHYNFAIDLSENITYYSATEQEFNERNLCVLMAASFNLSKPPAGSHSLLYERYQVVKWFAENHPQEFSLYSRGINPGAYANFKGLGLLQRILPVGVAARIAAAVATSRKARFDAVNRGPAPFDGKIPTLRRYRFNIAYENTSDLPGYLTEKLFDSLAACCVPIYWGDPDVATRIPEQCFVDRRRFKNTAELYEFISGMRYEEYQQYVDAITAFAHGASEQVFGSEANAWRISKVVLRDLGIELY